MIVTDDNYKQEILDFQGVAIVDFWAPWCGPCRIQGPIIEDVAEKYKTNPSVRVAKLDTDENPQVAMGNQIFSIPTLIFYKNGEIAEKFVGLRSQEDIEQKLEELLQSP